MTPFPHSLLPFHSTSALTLPVPSSTAMRTPATPHNSVLVPLLMPEIFNFGPVRLNFDDFEVSEPIWCCRCIPPSMVDPARRPLNPSISGNMHFTMVKQHVFMKMSVSRRREASCPPKWWFRVCETPTFQSVKFEWWARRF